MIVFDTNVWVAVDHETDTQHETARNVFAAYHPPYLLPEYVLIETVSVLERRVSKAVADSFLRRAMDNDDIELLVRDEFFLRTVAALFLHKRFHDLSFVDVSLLYLSAEHEVITFDVKLARAIAAQSQR